MTLPIILVGSHSRNKFVYIYFYLPFLYPGTGTSKRLVLAVSPQRSDNVELAVSIFRAGVALEWLCRLSAPFDQKNLQESNPKRGGSVSTTLLETVENGLT